MVDLYRDPRGEGVFGKATADSASASQYKSDMTYATQSGNFATLSGSLEYDNSIKTTL